MAARSGLYHSTRSNRYRNTSKKDSSDNCQLYSIIITSTAMPMMPSSTVLKNDDDSVCWMLSTA